MGLHSGFRVRIRVRAGRGSFHLYEGTAHLHRLAGHTEGITLARFLDGHALLRAVLSGDSQTAVFKAVALGRLYRHSDGIAQACRGRRRRQSAVLRLRQGDGILILCKAYLYLQISRYTVQQPGAVGRVIFRALLPCFDRFHCIAGLSLGNHNGAAAVFDQLAFRHDGTALAHDCGNGVHPGLGAHKFYRHRQIAGHVFDGQLIALCGNWPGLAVHGDTSHDAALFRLHLNADRAAILHAGGLGLSGAGTGAFHRYGVIRNSLKGCLQGYRLGRHDKFIPFAVYCIQGQSAAIGKKGLQAAFHQAHSILGMYRHGNRLAVSRRALHRELQTTAGDALSQGHRILLCIKGRAQGHFLGRHDKGNCSILCCFQRDGRTVCRGGLQRVRAQLIAGKGLRLHCHLTARLGLQRRGNDHAALAGCKLDLISRRGKGDLYGFVLLNVGQHQTTILRDVLSNAVHHNSIDLIALVRGNLDHRTAAGSYPVGGKQLGLAVFTGHHTHREVLRFGLIFPHALHHGVVNAAVAALYRHGEQMVFILLCLRDRHRPHAGRHLTVPAQLGSIQSGGLHLLAIQLEGQRAILRGGVRLAQRGNTGIQLHTGAIELDAVGRILFGGPGEAQVLILGILHMLHPAVCLVAVRFEAIVVSAHGLGGHGFRLICKVIFRRRIGGALIQIFLYRIGTGAVLGGDVGGQAALIAHLCAVDARLTVVQLFNGQGVDALFQILEHQTAAGTGLPLGLRAFVGDGRPDVPGLVCPQQQLHPVAVEGEGGPGSAPVGEMAVVFQGILGHAAAVGLGFPIGPQAIIVKTEQAAAHGVIVHGDGIDPAGVQLGALHLHFIDGGHALCLGNSESDALRLHGRSGGNSPHALVFGQLAQGLPFTGGIFIFRLHDLDGASLFHHGQLAHRALGEGIFQRILLRGLLGLPVGGGVAVEGKGRIGALRLRAGQSGGIGVPEIEVGFAAAQGDGKAAVLVQRYRAQFTAIVLLHLIQGITGLHKSRVCGESDLLAGILGTARLTLGDVELIVALGSARHQAIHHHECLGRGGAGKILGDLALVQAGQGVEVAQHHVAGLAAMGFGQALHLHGGKAEFPILGSALLTVEVAAAESTGRRAVFTADLAHLEHDPVVVQAGELIVNGVNPVDQLAPFQQAAGGGAVLIPQIAAVELVLHPEEIQPLHAGQNRGIHHQILVGLGVVEGEGIQILAEHDGHAAGAVHTAVSQLAVALPGGQVQQPAGRVLLHIPVGKVDAGGIGPARIAVVVVPGEQVRLGNAQVLLHVGLAPLVGELVGMQDHAGVMLAGPGKPFAEGLGFAGAVAALVTEA